MSGGVDSSVAAYLLLAEGYDVIGLHMKNWDLADEIGEGECPALSDFNDVQRVCKQLQIPALQVNFVKPYWNRVFQPALDDYSQGLTPNPDVLCNREIKFDAFLKHALELGDMVATGHYARVEANRSKLLAGVDPQKDQSYFLSLVPGNAFDKVLFPLGGMHKQEVRQIAREAGLCTADKKDSYGICMVGKRKFSDFISDYVELPKGPVLDLDGKPHPKMPEHKGSTLLTIGQGAGIAGEAAKWFVVGKCALRNAVFVAPGLVNTLGETDGAGTAKETTVQPHPALYSDYAVLDAASFNWVGGVPAILTQQDQGEGGGLRCQYRVRYRQPLGWCKVSLINGTGSAYHGLGLGRNSTIRCGCCADFATECCRQGEMGAAAAAAGTADASTGPATELLLVEFEHPQRAVTPQQIIALYDGDECLGGGGALARGPSYHTQGKSLPADVRSWVG
jgi:tRNA-specific 2-thiouridylase